MPTAASRPAPACPTPTDLAGRRTQDDRFVYVWNWRGELVEVTVKETWPDAGGDGQADQPPFAGHQVRYTYDAAGRRLFREHRGRRPLAGGEDDRSFVDLREYVWDGEALSTEISWTTPDRTASRWRKTYVPGSTGLDDAVQVVVEVGAEPDNPFAGSTHLYTYLRDEMGTIVGVVAEDEDPAEASQPAAPVRYLYTPYGEAHAETGPELRRAHFESSVTSAGGIPQQVSDEHAAVPGAMVLDWSLGLDEASLTTALVVEKLEPGSGWTALPPDQAVVVTEEGEDGLGRVVALAIGGWQASTSYRVRIKPELRDILGRTFGKTESLEWRAPDPPADASEPLPPIAFDKKVPLRFESWEAASNPLGGRFPGGQNSLFQGLYTDSLTGLSYARARWFDARNGSWVSEDPMGTADSSSLYAFVGHIPNMGTDPLGLLCVTENGGRNRLCNAIDEFELSSDSSWWKVAAAVTVDTLGNTVTDLLGLNTIADAPHVVLDSDKSTGERIWAGAKGVGTIALDVAGGAILKRGFTLLGRIPGASGLRGSIASSRLGQAVGRVLSREVPVPARLTAAVNTVKASTVGRVLRQDVQHVLTGRTFSRELRRQAAVADQIFELNSDYVRSRNLQTIASVGTRRGTTVVGGQADLSRAQRVLAQNLGADFGISRGVHAEFTALARVEELGEKPLSLAIRGPQFCYKVGSPQCRPRLIAGGWELISKHMAWKFSPFSFSNYLPLGGIATSSGDE